MGRFFEEYGNLIISTLISIFVIALLFIVLNANTLLGLKTEVSGNIKCEMPDYPYSFEVEGGNLENESFVWKNYVTAYDKNNASLLDHVVVNGNVNTKKSGAYLVAYTLYYRGHSETLYGVYTVKYDNPETQEPDDPVIPEPTLITVESLTISTDNAYAAGSTLTASVLPSEATGTYKWYRGNTAIEGATNSTYTLVDADAAYQIKCVFTANGDYTGSVSDTTGAIYGYVAKSGNFVTMTANNSPAPASALRSNWYAKTCNMSSSNYYYAFDNNTSTSISWSYTATNSWDNYRNDGIVLLFGKEIRVKEVELTYSTSGIDWIAVTQMTSSSERGNDLWKVTSNSGGTKTITITLDEPMTMQGLTIGGGISPYASGNITIYDCKVTKWSEWGNTAN